MTTLICDFQSIVGEKIEGYATLTAGKVRPSYSSPAVVVHEPIKQVVTEGQTTFENVNPGDAVITVEWADQTQSATIRFVVPDSEEAIYLADCLSADSLDPDEIELLRWGIRENLSGAREMLEEAKNLGLTEINGTVEAYFTEAAEILRKALEAAQLAEQSLGTIDDKVTATEGVVTDVNQAKQQIQDLLDYIAALELELGKTSTDLAGAVGTINTISPQISAAAQAASEATQKAQNAVTELSNVQTANAAEFTSIKQGLDSATQTAKQATDAVAQTNQQLGIEVQRILGEVDTALTTATEATAQARIANENLETYQYQLGEIHQEQGRILGQQAEIVGSFEFQLAEIARLSAEISTAATEIETISGEQSALVTEMNTQVGSLNELTAAQGAAITAAKAQADKGVTDAAAASNALSSYKKVNDPKVVAAQSTADTARAEATSKANAARIAAEGVAKELADKAQADAEVAAAAEALRIAQEEATAAKNAASADATAKANAAQSAAETLAKAQAKAAQEAAELTAALDASEKANKAKADAEAKAATLATAAKDAAATALTGYKNLNDPKVTKAQADATKGINDAAAAKSAANQAALDATNKALAAQEAAETYAREAAEAAQAQAEEHAAAEALRVAKLEAAAAKASAATDAKAKADEAERLAKLYAEAQAKTAKEQAEKTAAQDAATKAENARIAAEANAKVLSDKAQQAAIAAQTSIDNLEIGGRNLFINSNFTWQAMLGGHWTIRSAYIEDPDGTRYLRQGYGWGIQFRIPAEPGEYTFSVDVRDPEENPRSSARLSLTTLDEDGNSLITDWGSSNSQVWGLTSNFQRITYHMTFPEGTVGIRAYLLNGDAATGNSVLHFSRPQLERGNKATDWTPAPEDVDASVAKAQAEAELARAEATTKSDAARVAAELYAKEQAEAAQADAEVEAARAALEIAQREAKAAKDAAAEDATAKANAARTAAENLAKAEAKAAKEAAEATAAADASTKANKAKTDAEAKAAQLATAAQNAAATALNTYKGQNDPKVTKAQQDATKGINNAATALAKANEANNKLPAITSDVASAAQTALEAVNALPGIRTDISAAKQQADKGVTDAADAKSAVDNLQVGGRNLLRDSKLDLRNNNYQVTRVNFAAGHNLQAEETVTLSIKGQLGEGKTQLTVHNSQSQYPWLRFTAADQGADGVYRITAPFKSNQANSHLFLYAVPSTVTTETNIEWIKLERGNKATDWSPAPEDVDAGITTAKDAADTAQQRADKGVNDAATAKQVAEQVGTDLENLEIGGRNYFLNSGGSGAPVLISSNHSAVYPITRGEDENGAWIQGAYADGSGWMISTYTNPVFTSGYGRYYSPDFRSDKIPYTQSLEVMCMETVRVSLGSGAPSFDLEPGVWTRIHRTVTSDTLIRPSGISASRIGDIPEDTRLYHRHWKLERGTRATDWTPAPEDAQAEIDSLINKADDLTTGLSQAATQEQYNQLNTRLWGGQGEINKLQSDINANNTAFQTWQREVNARRDIWEKASTDATAALARFAITQSQWNDISSKATNANTKAIASHAALFEGQNKWNEVAAAAIQTQANFATKQLEWNAVQKKVNDNFQNWQNAATEMLTSTGKFQILQKDFNQKVLDWQETQNKYNAQQTQLNAVSSKTDEAHTKALASHAALFEQQNTWNSVVTAALNAQSKANDAYNALFAGQHKWNEVASAAITANTNALAAKKALDDNQNKWIQGADLAIANLQSTSAKYKQWTDGATTAIALNRELIGEQGLIQENQRLQMEALQEAVAEQTKLLYDELQSKPEILIVGDGQSHYDSRITVNLVKSGSQVSKVTVRANGTWTGIMHVEADHGKSDGPGSTFMNYTPLLRKVNLSYATSRDIVLTRNTSVDHIGKVRITYWVYPGEVLTTQKTGSWLIVEREQWLTLHSFTATDTATFNAELQVGWDAAGSGPEYGIRLTVNGTPVASDGPRKGVGPDFPWQDGYRQMSIKKTVVIQKGQTVKWEAYVSSGSSNERRIRNFNARATYMYRGLTEN